MTIFGRIRKATRMIEAKSKKKAEELVSKLESSSEKEEEQEDPASINSSSKEGEGMKISSQSNPVDELESPFSLPDQQTYNPFDP